tara:strand:- start:5247 stop:8285 length:3039 start_codon:yes stop_codon:yes gene_type:complete
MQYQKINNSLGWLCFLIALTVYIITLEPTTSFWDCGEYIATAFKLQVGHPPGAPTFLLLGNFFANFAFGDVTKVAYMINLMSAVCSALTILFLFWTITAFAKRILKENGVIKNIGSIMGAGLVGALAYTFSDSFWFSAIEGEVYAMSSFFTALVFWAAIKWDVEYDKEGEQANRWLLLIMYLIGLSIGVHMLNLLAIPAVVYMYYFKKQKVSPKGMVITGVVSIIILGFIFFGMIPQIIKWLGIIERVFVNSLGLPFNSGTVFFIAALIGIIYLGLKKAKEKGWYLLHTAILGLTFILIGYSSFAVLVIRSNANTPIDENNPEEAVSLLAYLNREQYGSNPLFYGQYYSAERDKKNPFEDGTPVYVKDEKSGKYIISDSRKNHIPNFDKSHCGFFPRMWSNSQRHIEAYKKWGNIKGGNNRKPKFIDNLSYFLNYQINHMYFRYFMWNFAGKQNDIQSHGSVSDGQWLSGITIFDSWRLGPQENLPTGQKNNPGRNHFYMLPFFLGIIGLIYHYKQKNRDAWIVTLLFVFTGIAIVVYLNQYPFQPRERDYAYVGSFYAFAIWIGIGVLALIEKVQTFIPMRTATLATTLICLIAVPGIMASEGWDDHNRSNRYTARDFAKAYLDSCDPNAILFTMGDNDTFPLWYIQEVEGYRTDIRIVNLSLLNTDWYIDQMKRDAYDGKGVPFTMPNRLYKQGTRDAALFKDVGISNQRWGVDRMNKWIQSDLPQTKINLGKDYVFFPTKKLSIPVDKQKVIENGTVKSENVDKIVSSVDWNLNVNQMEKKHMMIIDMIDNNKWERPIYFSITIGNSASSYSYLWDYFQLDGLAYRFIPIKTKSDRGQIGRIDSDILYKNLMEKFEYGNMNSPDVYLDETNLRLVMNVRNNFSRLADQLIKEGNPTSAVKVLDKCLELMPHEKVELNYFALPIIENYYICEQNKKARDIITQMIGMIEEKLTYFGQFSGENKDTILGEIQRALSLYNSVVKIAVAFEDIEYSNKLAKGFQDQMESNNFR